MAGGANAKMRILRYAARQLRIPEERLVFSGHRRAIFAAPLAVNWRDFLLGRSNTIAYLSYPLDSVTKQWKANWLSRRLMNSSVVDQVRLFRPDDLRITNVLRN
jgi:hypothetical protein